MHRGKRGPRKSALDTMMTTDYGLFGLGPNRDLKPAEHALLRGLMERHGFLESHPILVYEENGRLIIWDGQHRWFFAQELRLPVHYRVIAKPEVGLAEAERARKAWKTVDFVRHAAANGHELSQRIERMSEEHGLTHAVARDIICDIADAHIAWGDTGKFDGTERPADEASMLLDLVMALPKPHRCHAVAAALCEIIRVCPNVTQLRSRLAKYGDMLRGFKKKADLVSEIDRLYNYQSKGDARYDLVAAWRASRASVGARPGRNR